MYAEPAAEVAEAWWHEALYRAEEMFARDGRGREGGPDEPARTKLYRHAERITLPRVTDSTPLRRLSELLYYGFGLNRHEVGRAALWPYHRSVPSARCLFPTELYCYVRGEAGCPAGIYYYDPAHHALVAVRTGDQAAVLGQLVEAAVADAPYVVLLSTVFWKTAFVYRSYAYRLCSQESGMVAGNVMAVAGGLGLSATLHHHFDGSAADALIGADTAAERVSAVLVLRPRGPGRPRERRPVATVAGQTWSGAEVARLSRVRTSGPPTFNPAPAPTGLSELERLVGRTRPAYRTDAAGVRVACFVWTPGPDGVVYRQESDRLAAMPDSADRSATLLALADRQSSRINFRTASAVVYLAADRAPAQQVFGSRFVRVISQEAGVLAHGVCLAAADQGLTARVHNGYAAAAVRDALGLNPTWDVVFQIALGRPRTAGAPYHLPVTP